MQLRTSIHVRHETAVLSVEPGHTGAAVGFYGFGASHVYLSYLLYTLVAFHIGGALKHEWIDRHRELRRMMPVWRRH